MNDASPEIEALLKARYAAMSGSERALMALQMFETAQQVVLSSLDPTFSEGQRRRELCRRFYGDALAQVAFPETVESVFERQNDSQRLIDMKAARASGVTLPQSVLLRADEVIE